MRAWMVYSDCWRSVAAGAVTAVCAHIILVRSVLSALHCLPYIFVCNHYALTCDHTQQLQEGRFLPLALLCHLFGQHTNRHCLYSQCMYHQHRAHLWRNWQSRHTALALYQSLFVREPFALLLVLPVIE
jgi:hypothetical protein